MIMNKMLQWRSITKYKHNFLIEKFGVFISKKFFKKNHNWNKNYVGNISLYWRYNVQYNAEWNG